MNQYKQPIWSGREGEYGMDKISVIERGYKAVATGECGTLREIFTDDAEWQLMDRSEVARRFQGKEAVIDFLLRIRNLRLEAIMSVHDFVVAAHSFTLKSGVRVTATTVYEFSDGLVRTAVCSDIMR
jgi:ketosteroid isomerase-like protein